MTNKFTIWAVRKQGAKFSSIAEYVANFGPRISPSERRAANFLDFIPEAVVWLSDHIYGGPP